MFNCLNGSNITVPLSALCDGVDDCGEDGGHSDETVIFCAGTYVHTEHYCKPVHGGCSVVSSL